MSSFRNGAFVQGGWRGGGRGGGTSSWVSELGMAIEGLLPKGTSCRENGAFILGMAWAGSLEKCKGNAMMIESS